jgi:soluble lytic murein transglycosylase-like protein
MTLLYNKEQAILPLVQSKAEQYSVEPALILAHIKQESAFDPKAYREEPAINDASTGLMQLLLGTAKMLDSNATEDLLYDPEYNVDLGTRLIAKNLTRYDGNLQDAIAAYNAGSARKNSDGLYSNSKGIPNVQSYVNKVYANYIDYTNWLAKGATLVDIDSSIVLAFAIVAGGLVYYAWTRD